MAAKRRRPPAGRSRAGRPRQGSGRQSAAGPGARGAGESRRPRGPGGDRVEGRHAVRELLLAGTRRTREVVITAGLDPAPILEDITALASELRVPVRELGRAAFDALADTESAQGVLAEADPLPTVELEDLADEDMPFLVMVDGVTDPHNLGAIFRSADAAGVTGIVLPRHRAARVSPTVAKTAAGAVEHVPIATVAGVPAAISSLRDRNIWVVGLDESGQRSVFDLHLADEPLCLVLGAEGAGLSRLVRERCDDLVAIPMQGGVASLNVSSAAAVAFFEVSRRRGL